VGGPDNITVVAARFEGSGLQASRPDDEVRYRAFEDAVGDQFTAAEDVTQPWPAQAAVDEDRRRRGMIYSRIIAGIGVGILLWVAWRFFFSD
jgi:hypothetical protein